MRGDIKAAPDGAASGAPAPRSGLREAPRNASASSDVQEHHRVSHAQLSYCRGAMQSQSSSLSIVRLAATTPLCVMTRDHAGPPTSSSRDTPEQDQFRLSGIDL